MVENFGKIFAKASIFAILFFIQPLTYYTHLAYILQDHDYRIFMQCSICKKKTGGGEGLASEASRKNFLVQPLLTPPDIALGNPPSPTLLSGRRLYLASCVLT